MDLTRHKIVTERERESESEGEKEREREKKREEKNMEDLSTLHFRNRVHKTIKVCLTLLSHYLVCLGNRNSLDSY